MEKGNALLYLLHTQSEKIIYGHISRRFGVLSGAFMLTPTPTKNVGAALSGFFADIEAASWQACIPKCESLPSLDAATGGLPADLGLGSAQSFPAMPSRLSLA